MRRLRGRQAEPIPAPDPHEQAILDALTELRTTSAREVMTPRVDVVALPLPVSMDDVVRAVKESGHSRFPVYEQSLDELRGVLFVKDLFRLGLDPPPSPEVIARRLRQPYLVPEARLVPDVLREMRQRRAAFAVVVDEYGGVEGVLTVKDLVSELVGELHDEFDREPEEDIVRVDANRWLVDGACPVDRVSEEVGVMIPEGDYVTLGGFLFATFGRIPEEGDELTAGGWTYRIEEMDRRRIAKVVVRAPSGNLTPSSHGL